MRAARVENDKFPRTADLREADLPDWNIGHNFPVMSLSVQRLDELLTFLSRVAANTAQEFIIGEWVLERGISEDLAFIGPEMRQESVQFLREQVGVAPYFLPGTECFGSDLQDCNRPRPAGGANDLAA